MRPRFKNLAASMALIMLMCLCPMLTATAAPAFPGAMTIEEPATGTMVTIKNYGDEFFDYMADMSGYVVELFDDYFWYVDEIDGAYQLGARVTNTTQAAGDSRVSAKTEGLQEKLVALRRELEAQSVQTFSIGGVQPIPDGYSSNTAVDDAAKGKMVEFCSSDFDVPKKASRCPLLVLHIQYADLTGAFSDADWHKRIFDDGVANYYSVVSNGAFTYTPMHETSGAADDGVITVTLPIEAPLWARNSAGNLSANNGIQAGMQTGTDGLDYAIYNESSLYMYGLLAAEKYLPDLTSYDRNRDGVIAPTELAVIVVVASVEVSSTGSAPQMGKPAVWAHSWELNDYLLDATKEYYTGDRRAATVKEKKFYKYTMIGEAFGGTVHTGSLSSWSNAVQMQFGTACHELGHDLGLKDLYNTTENYTSLDVLSLSLMDSGSWGSASGSDVPGSCPTHLDAFSKAYLGFDSPTTVTADGIYTLNAPESQAGYNILRINTADPDVFYLLENRRLLGYDRGLQWDLYKAQESGGGIVIWRIDNGVISRKWDMNLVNTEEDNYGIMPVFENGEWNFPFWGGYFYENEFQLHEIVLEGTTAKLSFFNVPDKSMNVLITFDSRDKAPEIITQTLPDGQVDRAYSVTLQADGTKPITWKLDWGNLPDGLTLGNGRITGTPTAVGSYGLLLRAANGLHPDALMNYTLNVRPAGWVLSLTASPIEGGTVTGGGEYSPGEQVTLQAAANPGYRFVCWRTTGLSQTYSEDNPLTITLNQDMSLTAVFAAELLIQTEPADQTADEGETALFSVKASGVDLRYQWRIDRRDGQGWQTVQGGNQSTHETSILTLKNDDYRYACTMTDAYGRQLTTREATLHVNKKATPPQTGDDSQPILWLTLLIMSGGALVGMLLWRKAHARDGR